MTREEIECLMAMCRDTEPGVHWECPGDEYVSVESPGMLKVCAGNKILIAVVCDRAGGSSGLGDLIRELTGEYYVKNSVELTPRSITENGNCTGDED